MGCSVCKGELWICEEHPELPWPHDDCAGPGMPCRCSSSRIQEDRAKREQAMTYESDRFTAERDAAIRRLKEQESETFQG